MCQRCTLFDERTCDEPQSQAPVDAIDVLAHVPADGWSDVLLLSRVLDGLRERV